MIDKVKMWLHEMLQAENFGKYEIELDGRAGKTDGFMSEILFVTVQGTTKRLNVTLKVSKDNETFQNDVGKDAFKNEIHVYDNVFPALEKFQLQKMVLEPFNSYPKCYKCLTLKNRDIIVLENLKASGYEIHDKFVSLNLAHTKAVLRRYAKLHAVSFAMRDQRREEFDSLVECLKEVIVDFWTKPSSTDLLLKSIQYALDMFKKFADDEQYQAYVDLSKGAVERFLKICGTEEKQVVITHGDCWNNNLMFKYESNDKSEPSSLMMLDWQMSYHRSPAWDLTYFLFLASSSNWKMFDRLLKEYHDMLSRFIEELGSSPQLFTFEDLQRDWKMWDVIGIVFAPMAFKFILGNNDTVPDFGEIKEGTSLENYLDIEVANEKAYYERFKCIVEYLRNRP